MFTIKKNKKTGNEYVLTSTGMWVRNFGKRNAKPIDINNLFSSEDYSLLIDNEFQIKIMKLPDIESEISTKRKCIILSDGYEFEKARNIIPKIPKDITVIGVNRSLARWKKDGQLIKRKMDYFLVNNPYNECMMFMPGHRYFPKCIISSKTNPKFAERYEGVLYQYTPVFGEKFRGDEKYSTQLDDYRNPICAAISLANYFKATKVAMLCCDNSFAENRPGSVKLENGLYMYPQHYMSHGLIEGCLYWLSHQEDRHVDIVDSSKGPEYKEVPYIEIEELVNFFNEGM